MSEEKLDLLISAVTEMRQDMAQLKTDVAGLSRKQEELARKQDEMLAASRLAWADLSTLYRAVRDDLQRFEERVERKLSEVRQSIQALKDSLEAQDYRRDELARRIVRLETTPEPPL